MRRYILDTAIFAYALGRPHHYKAPCRQLIDAVKNCEFEACISAELVQEFAHLYLRKGASRRNVRLFSEEIIGMTTVFPLEIADLKLSLQLLEQQPSLSARDAIHAATALNHGITNIVSPDRDFDPVPGLRRIDPLEFSTDS